MKKGTGAKSTYLYLTGYVMDEFLRRALIVCDTVVLPWSGAKQVTIPPSRDWDKYWERLLNSERVALLGADSLNRWASEAREDHENLRRWGEYFADAVLRAFEADSVDIRWHGDPKLAYIWDNGKGHFPPNFIGERMADMYEQTSTMMDIGTAAMIEDRLRPYEKILKRKRHHSPLRGATLSAHRRTGELLILCRAMTELSASSPPYARLGLLGQSYQQVKWITGIGAAGIEYNTLDQNQIGTVLSAALPQPSMACRLTDIPYDRFLDICDQLGEARSSFAQHVSRWASDLSSIEHAAERTEYIRKLRRDEIVPAMEQFNSEARTDIKKVLGAVSGDQWTGLALGAIAAGVCLLYGLPIDPATAFVSTAAVGAAGSVAKDMIERKHKNRRTWTAFAAALSDEIGRFGDPVE